jgi:hypothetical protein
VRERINALIAQARQLGTPIVDARLVGGGLVHAAGGY